MSQNFVIAFGGTGARSIEALTYLAASNAINAPMHVLIVDPDESNGNVSEAVRQLRRYYSLQAKIQRQDTDRPSFFSLPVNAGLGDGSFLWTNPQPNEEFQTLIEFASQRAEEQDLLKLLYDQSDLNLTFEKGYIGRAHIGSLDLLRNLEAQIVNATRDDSEVERNDSGALQVFFKALRSATQQPGGARLIVLGSVFGGTGASGLPAIPPLLSNVLLSGLDNQLKIACVQIAPYFTFPPGGEEDPDSAMHPLATQAALFHYGLTDTGYDRIYLLGAPHREPANSENVAGGSAQRNQAHYVELATALAIAHFFDNPPEAESVEVVTCGSEGVTWSDLPYRSATHVQKNLASFATFCALHSGFLALDLAEGRHEGTKWQADLESGSARTLGGKEPEIKAMADFGKRFLAWATEVNRIDDVKLLTPGTIDDPNHLSSLTEGGGKSPHPYHALISNLNTSRNNQQRTGIGWYVASLTSASFRFCETNYSSWWH
jgi:hypothetical protein